MSEAPHSLADGRRRAPQCRQRPPVRFDTLKRRLSADRFGSGMVVSLLQKWVALPFFTLSDTPARLRSTAPSNGQHSAEVLSDLLGYDEARIVAMQQQGVIL